LSNFILTILSNWRINDCNDTIYHYINKRRLEFTILTINEIQKPISVGLAKSIFREVFRDLPGEPLIIILSNEVHSIGVTPDGLVIQAEVLFVGPVHLRIITLLISLVDKIFHVSLSFNNISCMTVESEVD
jgi:hypothetical protein